MSSSKENHNELEFKRDLQHPTHWSGEGHGTPSSRGSFPLMIYFCDTGNCCSLATKLPRLSFKTHAMFTLVLCTGKSTWTSPHLALIVFQHTTPGARACDVTWLHSSARACTEGRSLLYVFIRDQRVIAPSSNLCIIIDSSFEDSNPHMAPKNQALLPPH